MAVLTDDGVVQLGEPIRPCVASIVNHGTSTSTVSPHRPSTQSLAATTISPTPVGSSKVIDLVKSCSATCGG